MLGISWISEDLDQLVVAADAATIFRGAGVHAGETDGVLEFRIGREGLLHDDLVFPAVAEVVLIDKTSLRRRSQVSDGVAFLAERSRSDRVWCRREDS